jgi:hypothetical protein
MYNVQHNPPPFWAGTSHYYNGTKLDYTWYLRKAYITHICKAGWPQDYRHTHNEQCEERLIDSLCIVVSTVYTKQRKQSVSEIGPAAAETGPRLGLFRACQPTMMGLAIEWLACFCSLDLFLTVASSLLRVLVLP